MMSFSDPQFIFRFLPLFLAVYYITPSVYRRFVLLCASLLFYALGDIRFFALLLVATIVNHVLGRDVIRKRRHTLVVIVTLDVLLLITFKTLGAVVSSQLIPVGISFYTFKMISYQADLYRGKISPAPSAIDTATYFTMFPHVVMGPIMRYPDYAQISVWHLSALKSNREHRRSYLSRLEEGAFYFCLGLACKVLLADHLAQAWQAIGTIGYAHISTPLAWIGVLIYSLNLYYDFWGYSLMAAGIGVAMGFPFVENFHHPYAAASVADFYRRWHMTLGAWFRDYVYIPLGGSKRGALRTIRNLFVVWLLTALWHGVTVTFLIWGMMLFFLIVWEKCVLSHVPLLHRVLGRLHVLILVPLSWIPFAMGKWSYLTGYFHRLFPFFDVPANVFAQDYVSILEGSLLYLIFGLLGLFPPLFSVLKRHRTNPLVVLLLLALFWLSVYSLALSAGNPFMYFRF